MAQRTGWWPACRRVDQLPLTAPETIYGHIEAREGDMASLLRPRVETARRHQARGSRGRRTEPRRSDRGGMVAAYRHRLRPEGRPDRGPARGPGSPDPQAAAGVHRPGSGAPEERGGDR